jgi:hypothetical protein
LQPELIRNHPIVRRTGTDAFVTFGFRRSTLSMLDPFQLSQCRLVSTGRWHTTQKSYAEKLDPACNEDGAISLELNNTSSHQFLPITCSRYGSAGHSEHELPGGLGLI